MGKLIMVDFSPQFRNGLLNLIKEAGLAKSRDFLLEHGYDPHFVEVMIRHVARKLKGAL